MTLQYADEYVEHHIVFIHGLGLGVLDDWLSGGIPAEHWPLWLKSDLENIAIWTIAYDAARTKWRGTSMSIVDRAENLLALLKTQPELQTGEISIIAYSFGGLVTKQILRAADSKKAHDSLLAQILRNVRRVCFLGVPHFGSDVASLGRKLRLPFRPSVAAAGLTRNDPNLRDLGTWYKHYEAQNGIRSLSLRETREVRFLGTIVKPDSADPGLLSDPIPVDADHDTIRAPKDREAEVYKHIRDFLKTPVSGAHQDTLVAEALKRAGSEIISSSSKNTEAVLQKLDTVISAAGAKAGSSVIDAEVDRQLWVIRRSRYFLGSDTHADVTRLHADLVGGELSAASSPIKMKALAWCARLTAVTDNKQLHQDCIEAAKALGDCEEIRIAVAFNLSNTNKPQALSDLHAINSAASRAASFAISAREVTAQEALAWLAAAGINLSSLDSDGKFLAIQKYFEARRWSDALAAASNLQEADFEAVPALLLLAANAHLVQAVPEEIRIYAIEQLPNEARSFPLADNVEALNSRRLAIQFYERGAAAASRLSCDTVVNLTNDRVLWLQLRDPDTAKSARVTLAQSMREPAHSLRRLPLALEFGLNIDVAVVEREIEQQTTISGGKSVDAAVARFALAFTKSTPKEVADYIDQHRQQFHDCLDPQGIGFVEVQMLARSGQSAPAEKRLEELVKDGLGNRQRDHLKRIIAESKGSNPVQVREARFRETNDISDLANLVELLKDNRDWIRLTEYAYILYDRAKDIPSAALYANALYETGNFQKANLFLESNAEFLERSNQISTIAAWIKYKIGDFEASQKLLEQIRSARDESGDRLLEVNLAIASGNWTALVGFADREWEKREQRTPYELLRAAHLANYVGSMRAKDLVVAAAQKGPDLPDILVGCYGVAVSAGWESDPEVSSWLQTAASLSGSSGPIQRVSLQELLDRQPDWNRREADTWGKLNAGELPIFGAAHLLNRSLINLFLFPALSNPQQSDVRKRSIVFAYSGARMLSAPDVKSITVDATALLTFGILGIVRKVFAAIPSIVVPHSTMAWLFNERQRIQFHQPSRLRDAEEIRRLLDNGTMKRLDVASEVDATLTSEIGDALAELLTEASNERKDDVQRLVVRPYPVHRVSSLMEEIADLSAFSSHLCGCVDIIDALVQRGGLTAAEERRARDYLSINEQRWPHSIVISDNASLFLDDVAILYFQHLGIIPSLHAAGFTVYVAERESSERAELIEYASLTVAATRVIDDLQHELASGIANGTVRVSTMSGIDGSDEEDIASFRLHPSATILSSASNSDALVIDDRAINQHAFVAADGCNKPILTSLDVLALLGQRGVFDNNTLLEYRTSLRRAGFAFVPVQEDELRLLLTRTTIRDGSLVETAELKALRENVLRLQMSDILQLPKEHMWLAELSQVSLQTLRAQWQSDISDDVSRARSEWLLKLFDFRGWMHRVPKVAGQLDGMQANLRIVQLMLRLDGRSRSVNERYMRWFEERLLKPILEEEPDAYEWISSNARTFVEGAIENGMKSQNE